MTAHTVQSKYPGWVQVLTEKNQEGPGHGEGEESPAMLHKRVLRGLLGVQRGSEGHTGHQVSGVAAIAPASKGQQRICKDAALVPCHSSTLGHLLHHLLQEGRCGGPWLCLLHFDLVKGKETGHRSGTGEIVLG